MSTDIYGVRVLDVDPKELRVRFTVFAVYYDTGSRSHPPVPGDPGYFFFLLWEAARWGRDGGEHGALARMFSVDTMLDYAWLDANARRFVPRVERIASRNHPPTAAQWERLHDFYYLRDGGWKDEDLLVQFDYDVWVTDERCIETLAPGKTWASTIFPMHGDTWTAADAPHIPDLAEPVHRISPFAGKKGEFKYQDIRNLAFSDDGKYLAANTGKGLVWVYDTADWSEVAHTSAGDWSVAMPMWVPGEHVVTLKSYSKLSDPKPERQWAFDVRTGQETTASYQSGHQRSHDGVHRVTPNGGKLGGYDLHATDTLPQRTIVHAGKWDPIQSKAFSADGSRLFLGAQQDLYVVDPQSAEVVDKVADASERLFEIAASPDGSYLAAASLSRKLGYLGPFDGRRPHELCVWRMADRRIILGRQMETFVTALAWSPDGRHLVAVLEPCDGNFGLAHSELAVFRMGPETPPFPFE
ncbi:WD40 repeat domain-containing protein [Yinghuangia sp. YIM S09857]|uniref:WD40 repeat domain-containing protein n=1 Tax=Yinghuangia sp. YIM S09857 TaxID=3436929 RepID=UPI003F52C5A7